MRKVLMIALLTALIMPAPSWGQTNTLEDAVVGEWARYSTSSVSTQERHSVITRNRQMVVVRVESIVNGKVISSTTEHFNIDNPHFLRGAEGRQQVTIGQRTFDCIVVQRGERTLFYSNEVPVTGLVLVRTSGQTIKEVIDFGG